MSVSGEANGTAAAVAAEPTLYLRVPRKRSRTTSDDDNSTEGECSGSGSLSYVRLRWSYDEMGAAPFSIHFTSAQSSSATSLVFRRLVRLSCSTAGGEGSSSSAPTSTKAMACGSPQETAGKIPVEQQRYLTVRRLRKTGPVVMIDCHYATDSENAVNHLPSSLNGTEEDDEHDLFILDTKRTCDAAAAAASDSAEETEADRETERESAMEDEFNFDDLIISDGGESWGDKRSRSADALAAIRTLGKRQRVHLGDECDVALPLYCLKPPRLEGGPTSASATISTIAAATVAAWGEMEEADETLLDMLRGYGDGVNSAVTYFVPEESTREVQADLYCYPDHRNGDEYDSNAEDFSGNDYPEDVDDVDNKYDVERGSYDGDSDEDCQHAPYSGGGGGYGMYYEDGYHERAPSSGWRSEYDEDDDDASS